MTTGRIRFSTEEDVDDQIAHNLDSDLSSKDELAMAFDSASSDSENRSTAVILLSGCAIFSYALAVYLNCNPLSRWNVLLPVCSVTVNDDRCTWQFDHYKSSAWEIHWMQNIHEFQNKVCEILAKSEEVNKTIEVHRRISELQQTVYNFSSFASADQHLSELHYQLSCSHESRPRLRVLHKIEPLIGLTRDPLTICPRLSIVPSDLYLEGEYAVQSKRFILLGPSAPSNAKPSHHSLIPAWLSSTVLNVRTPQTILFDIGSSYFNSINGTEPGAHVSSRWFYEYLKSKSIPLDRIIAFEYTPLAVRTAWEQLPSDVLPIYTLINVGVEEKGKFNPWRIIQTIAHPHDYVLVKLDIDNDALEHSLLRQIMASRKLQGLIDELFYEMHVTVPAMHKYWGTFRNTTLEDMYKLFIKFREMGIRMHSWP